ncbi:MAG TPA: hypothetical protein VLY85_01610, partial [Thermoplasmata archaeon]|nr:hypothetical protein [Thermoplasmata archaeon]
ALLENPAFLDRVTSAYRGALGTLGQSARVPAFLEAAERFTDEVALAPDALRRRIRELRSPEVRVAQAMFGRSLFAVATTSAARRGLVRSLERLRLPALELGASIRGARRLVPGPAHAPGPGPVAARRDRRRAR